MPSYFKRYYLDDVKLAQRALLEFHRSLRSGRMIAFTGAMTTEGCGYGTWGDLVDVYARIGSDVKKGKYDGSLEGLIRKKPRHVATIDKILKYREDETRFDVRVALGLIEEVVIGHESLKPRILATKWDSDWELDRIREPVEELAVALAHYFRKPHRRAASEHALAAFHAELDARPGAAPIVPDLDVIEALLWSLGIRRFATLNYDFEIERATMLGGARDTVPPFERLRELRVSSGGEVFEWVLDSGRIRRVLANGQAIESDILNRERIDRMIEFSVGADDVDHHVLHLHGRACNPASMILSYRDYDRLYRRNDLYKLPFEFAQRIMIGGNPVVFVGLGMSEAEVNQALQDFISSSPYQRAAPTFLLWNYHKPREEMTAPDWLEVEMLRLDRFHRLGVLTIFDVDLPAVPGDASGLAQRPDAHDADEGAKRKRPRTPAASARGIHNLRWLVAAVPAHARTIAAREEYVDAKAWRHMGVKAGHGAGPFTLWKVVSGRSRSKRRTDHLEARRTLAPLLGTPGRNVCIIGPQGCGKGSLAVDLIDNVCDFGVDRARTMLVNGSFCFDTDSLLDGVARFLHGCLGGGYLEDRTGADGTARLDGPPTMSRSTYFASLAGYSGERVMIVLNGMERFFSINGHLLSAELDELLEIAAQGRLPQVTFAVFGSERVRRYMTMRRFALLDTRDLKLDHPDDAGVLPFDRLEGIKIAFADALGPDAPKRLAPGQQRSLDDAAAKFRALSSSRISGDSFELRRAFYDLYLSDAMFRNAFDEDDANDAPGHVTEVRIARELLRALAFIGIPTERAVLAHVARIRALGAATTARLDAVLGKLIALQLVIVLDAYRGSPEMDETRQAPRYTLPRTLLTELRYRFSVPLSEAKLSTAFNMSLYVAQPVDGFIPEPDIHDELGQMIDRLLGAYRDTASAAVVDDGRRAPLDVVLPRIVAHERPPFDGSEARRDGGRRVPLANELVALCGADHVRRLRAALALMRGYYTTTDLLTLDTGDRLIREDRDGVLLEHAERLDCLIDAYGKVAMARDALRQEMGPQFESAFGTTEPFYPDELVWLHNERGVVRLAMGDLYEAAASFNRALDMNRRHVEKGDRAHNWRRIRLNQLTIDIETGDLGLAVRKIEEILGVSPPRSDDNAGSDDHALRRREDRLATALARGYRGRARHLQGDAEGALADLDAAIAALAGLDETRAQAYFRKLRAEARRASGVEGCKTDIAAALDLAISTRQMDIAYRLRIMTAAELLATTEPDPTRHADRRAHAHRMLEDAMRYALQTDMHRIRVEAGSTLAEARLQSGDYEGALRNISDALMVATRFGMELRKIALRSVMARVMAARGHPITATKLALTTIKIASRRRYQPAIDHAEQTLARIPKIAAITDVVDASVRRQL